jgi:hypothetical protein
MKKIVYLSLASLCLILTSYQTFAQKCSGPIPVVSLYYPYQKGMTWGIGLEAGNLGGDSPFGIFAGFNVQKKSELYKKLDSAYTYDLKSSFYIKGSYRITRLGNAVSLYAIASPAISLEKGIDLQPGFRVVFPFGCRMGLGIETLYSLKEKQAVMNFHISF